MHQKTFWLHLLLPSKEPQYLSIVIFWHRKQLQFFSSTASASDSSFASPEPYFERPRFSSWTRPLRPWTSRRTTSSRQPFGKSSSTVQFWPSLTGWTPSWTARGWWFSMLVESRILRHGQGRRIDKWLRVGQWRTGPSSDGQHALGTERSDSSCKYMCILRCTCRPAFLLNKVTRLKSSIFIVSIFVYLSRHKGSKIWMEK